jgi:hypothetical protein
MANAINILKPYLILGSSLTLAVPLRCFAAEPMNPGSLAVLIFILVVLSLPLLAWKVHTEPVKAWRATSPVL